MTRSEIPMLINLRQNKNVESEKRTVNGKERRFQNKTPLSFILAPAADGTTSGGDTGGSTGGNTGGSTGGNTGGDTGGGDNNGGGGGDDNEND